MTANRKAQAKGTAGGRATPPCRRKNWRRISQFVLTISMLAGLGYLGMDWLSGLRFETAYVSGNRQVPTAEIESAARVDSGTVLMAIEPDEVKARVESHPWVESAGVYRMPPKFLLISVRERTPVALAVGSDGRPAAYLDRFGHTMQLEGAEVYDLPLVFGISIPRGENEPIGQAAIVELLGALSELDAETDAIISSFELVNGDITLSTTPAGIRGPIAVRLGKSQLGERLRRLRSFWYKAVLTRKDRVFEHVDLRFDGQIVTREVTK